MAQRPGHGGHTWVFLQYLLGFRRLGWDVLFLDRLEPGMGTDRSGAPAPPDLSVNVEYLQRVMSNFGLDGAWSLVVGREVLGLPRREVVERVRRSAVLLDVMGYLGDEELLAAAPERVFLDIDPGFGQMWCALGLHDPFRRHDQFVTIGENIGRRGCVVPTCDIDWIITKQPVVLDEWPATPSAHPDRFTSVGSWRGPFGPIEFDGETYGLRVHEFRRFVSLPARVPAAFEVALDIDEAEVRDLELLAEHGWARADPRAVAADPWAYRDYLRASGAELMVAKNLYVRSQCGWFSDRSICYLATGRPVLAQDTGLDGLVPVGDGLLTFTDIDEAVAGVHEITGDYERHARAARDLAESIFSSDVVLPALLARLGVD